MSTPKIQPISIMEYTVKKSKYESAGKRPIRSIILGPSGSGKTVLLRNMLLEMYKDCFNRIYIFSPSIDVDSSWLPVQQDIDNDLKVRHADDDPIYFDHYDPQTLHDIVDTQQQILII
jgi:Cdc6-like AAA superfamily ATPase